MLGYILQLDAQKAVRLEYDISQFILLNDSQRTKLEDYAYVIAQAMGAVEEDAYAVHHIGRHVMTMTVQLDEEGTTKRYIAGIMHDMKLVFWYEVE